MFDFTADAFDQRVELHWTPSSEAAGYLIRRSKQGPPTTPNSGDFVYSGSGFQLAGLNSDRGLLNGTTYFYSLFPLSENGLYGAPATVAAIPKKEEASKNLLRNPHFEEGLMGWEMVEKEGSYVVTGNGLRMQAKAVTSQLAQTVTHLEPKTLYTATLFAYSSNPQMTATWSIDGDIQQKEQGFAPLLYDHHKETGYWKLLRTVFWTSDQADPEVTLSLFGPKVEEPKESSYVAYSHVALQKGLLPMPDSSLDPKHPLLKPKPAAEQPKKGENLIGSAWHLQRALFTGNEIVLAPTREFQASASQLLPYYFPSSPHTLTALAKVDLGTTAELAVSDDDFFTSVKVTSSEWTAISIPIKGRWIHPLIRFTAEKGGHAYIKEVQLKASGDEWLPAPAHPAMQLHSKTWDFRKGVFDPNELLVFSGMNSHPENLSFVDEGLRFTAYGERAEHPEQGAIIMTRAYFCSGRYDIWFKVGPVYDEKGHPLLNKKPYGCSFPFFTFGYQHYMDGQPAWYDAPSAVRNSEIDIEIPADAPQNPHLCPPDIHWSNGRLNAYGGQRGGIHTNVSMHTQMPKDIDVADGRFHKFTIEWNSGDDHAEGRTPGWIKWFVDDQPWGSLTGSDYGFDNIPTRCCRIYVGARFPTNGYGPPGCEDAGWAGTADWHHAEFTVQKIEYTPPLKRPNRDSWQGEFDATWVWNPRLYPSS